MRTQLIFLCFVILSIVSSAFVLAQTPLDITTCSVTDGGKKFDLSKIQAQLAGKTGKDAAFVVNNNGMSTDYKYYFSPCQSIQGVCTEVPSAFSVQESTSFFAKNCYALAGSDGKSITAKSIDAASDKSPQKLGGVVLTYTGGSSKDLSTGDKERGIEVTLYCDPKETSAAFKLMDEVSQNGVRLYKIEGYSAYACGSSATSAGGAVAYFFLAPGFVGGFALFLLFILGLYFFIGILVNKLKFKKSGKEVIPNVEFWASIPGLIKEGAGVIGDGVMKCTKRGKYASLG